MTIEDTDLILSLFNIASAREVAFGTPQYVQWILHGLTNGFLCRTESSVFFILTTLITEVLFEKFLIYTAV